MSKRKLAILIILIICGIITWISYGDGSNSEWYVWPLITATCGLCWVSFSFAWRITETFRVGDDIIAWAIGLLITALVGVYGAIPISVLSLLFGEN